MNPAASAAAWRDRVRKRSTRRRVNWLTTRTTATGATATTVINGSIRAMRNSANAMKITMLIWSTAVAARAASAGGSSRAVASAAPIEGCAASGCRCRSASRIPRRRALAT